MQQVLVAGGIPRRDDGRMTERITLRDIVGHIHAMRGSLEGRMDAMEKRLDTKIDGLEQRLDAKIDNLETRLTRQIDALDGRLDIIENGVMGNDHEKRIRRLEAHAGFRSR